jgi:photosystem II stability/assembly factor-like uncharacterized protein
MAVLLIASGILLNWLDLSEADECCSVEAGYQHPELYPGEYMAHQRMYPYDEIRTDAYFEAMKQAEAYKKAPADYDYEWTFAGPTNIGGRITDIEMHPGSPETIYLGAATGGLWKSTDDGDSWTYAFEGIGLISVGDIAIDPNNENILYVGTGEANSSSYSFRGDGIYKSTDAGESWEFSGLEYSAYIGRIIVDYNNSDRLWAAACGNLFTPDEERGLYRSTDAGASWEKVLFVNDSTSAIDIVQHPTNPDILYASMWERMRGLTYRHSFGEGSGVYKSEDGGDTWTELTNGLLTGENVGRIGLTISQSDPDVLYAYYDLSFYQVAVFRTNDGGASWSQTNDGELQGMNSNFGWYFGQVRVHPEDEDKVWVMGVQMYTTSNAGDSWYDATNWGVHVDHHAMYFDQVNDRILLGNDGGLYESYNNGSSWDEINNLPFTQFYAIDIDYQDPDKLIGGTQDNNTILTKTGNTDDWYPVLGGDGMYCLIDYSNPDIIYAESQWGNLSKSVDGGDDFDYIAWYWQDDRVNWSAPLAMDPVDPEVLYFGTYRVWKSTNGGNSWTNVSGDLTQGIDQYFYTVATIAISPVNNNIVLAGTGDGMVHVSTNGGLSWDNVSEGLPDRWVTRVLGDPFDENTIYTTVSGFRWDEPLAHVYKSTDLGQSWESISGDLPGVPVNDIVADPDHAGYLYIGTDAGVFFTDNGGESWISLNEGIYNVPVVAMKIHNPSRQLVIGTYGLSMYRLNLDDLVTGVADNAEPQHEFRAYPNPFSRSLQLDGPVELVDDFRLYDISGKHIMWADKVRLSDLPELKPGMYYLHLLDKGGKTIAVEKVVRR